MQKISLFKDRKLVIATMHKKEMIMIPLLEKHLGVKVVVPLRFDSDKFGTFTRETARVGNQLEAARAKAHAAMLSEGVDLAIASEGSFGTHPSAPFVRSNFELVLLVDKKNGREIRGHHRTLETNMDGQYVVTVEDALKFACTIGFPEHGIIIRKREQGRFGIHKNILNEKELIEVSSKMLAGIFTKRIFIETDMRAHRNPTRMESIKKATEDLINNIKSVCPECHAPGFVVVDHEKGLKCSLCNIPTDLPLNDIYQCSVCNYTDKKLVDKYGKTADPQYCAYCNP